MADTPAYITAPALAALLNVKTDTVYKLAHRGDIPCVKVGGSVRFNPADFETSLKGGLPVIKKKS